jgi:hypothetical protein
MNELKLSIEFEDASEETAEVYIEGKVMDSPVKFLLDTGCAKTSLPHNDITKNLNIISSRESSGAISKMIGISTIKQ